MSPTSDSILKHRLHVETTRGTNCQKKVVTKEFHDNELLPLKIIEKGDKTDMRNEETEALKVVLFDHANREKQHGHKLSRWECLQFVSRAIEGDYIPREMIDYITQLNFQTNIIKS